MTKLLTQSAAARALGRERHWVGIQIRLGRIAFLAIKTPRGERKYIPAVEIERFLSKTTTTNHNVALKDSTG